MNREDFRQVLLNLLACEAGMKNPSIDALSALCPHLDIAQIGQILALVQQGKRVDFAAPPLQVRNGFYNLSIDPSVRNDGSTVLKMRKAQRLSAKSSVMFAAEAVAFACRNWGEALVDDSWAYYMPIRLDDPSDLSKSRYPIAKLIIGVGFKRTWADMSSDYSVPLSEILGANVAIATACPVLRCEIRGQLYQAVFYNCAYCGSGLSTERCNGCGHQFCDNGMRTGWGTPLPPVLVRVAEEAGLIFKKDPARAISTEMQQWLSENQES